MRVAEQQAPAAEYRSVRKLVWSETRPHLAPPASLGKKYDLARASSDEVAHKDHRRLQPAVEERAVAPLLPVADLRRGLPGREVGDHHPARAGGLLLVDEHHLLVSAAEEVPGKLEVAVVEPAVEERAVAPLLPVADLRRR